MGPKIVGGLLILSLSGVFSTPALAQVTTFNETQQDLTDLQKYLNDQIVALKKNIKETKAELRDTADRAKQDGIKQELADLSLALLHREEQLKNVKIKERFFKEVEKGGAMGFSKPHVSELHGGRKIAGGHVVMSCLPLAMLNGGYQFEVEELLYKDGKERYEGALTEFVGKTEHPVGAVETTLFTTQEKKQCVLNVKKVGENGKDLSFQLYLSNSKNESYAGRLLAINGMDVKPEEGNMKCHVFLPLSSKLKNCNFSVPPASEGSSGVSGDDSGRTQ